MTTVRRYQRRGYWAGAMGLLAVWPGAQSTLAQGSGAEDALIEEIFVTARGRDESLQDVPDAVTAFDADRIEALGIDDVRAVADQTPNFFIRESFRSGVTFITIRGITTGQQGFPPITYIVDGVKAATLDSINQGALFDIERIEVLKGPQGALYGAGAIAGAVNVVSKKPSDEFAGEVRAAYAQGNDATVKGVVSGPIVDETLLFRLSGYYRDADGLVDTRGGDDLNFEQHRHIKGRLLWAPVDTLSVDLRAAFTHIDGGAPGASRFDSIEQLNRFDSSLDPRRGILGEEDREFSDYSVKIDWELPFATLTSVTGYLDLQQDLFGTASWERPPALGEAPLAGGISEVILGENAGPGEPVDNFQRLVDDFQVFTQDIRLVSTGSGPLRWMFGYEYIEREVEQGFAVGIEFGPAADSTFTEVFGRFDDKEDEIWGVYGQLNWDISDRLELTLAARYDEDEYSSRQFDEATGATINQIDPGTGLATLPVLQAQDSKFQPKVSLSYDWSGSLMTYITYAEGFRFGFYNTGALTAAEETENVELGFKSQLADRRLSLSAALFFIDYSNQQLTNAIDEPPFRITTNVPSSDIQGVEAEFNWQASSRWTLNGGIGYLDTEIDGGGELDAVPQWTANLGLQYRRPIAADMEWTARLDWRHQGEHIKTEPGILYEIDAVDLINVRIGLQAERWSVQGFVNNVADQQFPIDPASFGAFFLRDYSDPRAAGVEVSYRF